METGVVHVERMIAVQDCGLIVNRRLAESQVYGGLIMGVGYALFEEWIPDPVTGRSAERGTWSSTSWRVSWMSDRWKCT